MTGPRNVEAYLAALPGDARRALERLRETIRSVVPEATEVISYQMPAFRYEGRMLVWYAGFKDHCSLFPASAGVRERLGDKLQPYLSGKGTIRFTPEKPLPASLVRRIVKVRIAENAAAKRR